jgi:hypothetical protein
MAFERCISRLQELAGRKLSDAEVERVFERIHKAALDLKAGRAEPGEATLGGKLGKELAGAGDDLISRAAERAAQDLAVEATVQKRNAYLQVVKIGARQADVERIVETGAKPLDAVEKTIVRDYSGRTNVESLEQKAAGYHAYFGSKLIDTWTALGDDWLGFFQDRTKLLNLVRELRGEKTATHWLAKGAQVYHDVAEEARQVFNENGGSVGKLDDWGMPQHHSQEKVASAGKDVWVDTILPMLDRGRYVDEFTGARGRRTRCANSSARPGTRLRPTATRTPSLARRAAPARWRTDTPRAGRFTSRTPTRHQLLGGVRRPHCGRDPDRARGPHGEATSPSSSTSGRTRTDLPDAARRGAQAGATLAEPTKTTAIEGRAVALDNLFNYVSGRTQPTYRPVAESDRRRHRAPEQRRQARRRGARVLLRRQADDGGGLAPQRPADVRPVADGGLAPQSGERCRARLIQRRA